MRLEKAALMDGGGHDAPQRSRQAAVPRIVTEGWMSGGQAGCKYAKQNVPSYMTQDSESNKQITRKEGPRGRWKKYGVANSSHAYE